MNKLRVLARLFSVVTAAALAAVLVAVLLVKATPLPDLTRAQSRSQLVTSSSADTLWGFLSAEGRWRLSVRQGDVDPLFLKVLLAYEDKRFRRHRGVDLVALLRATYQSISHGHAVSGGSTLTMQVVRMLEPCPRTLTAKLDQILKAIQLDRILSKSEILDLYLTMAPYGGNIEGLRAAALLYLDKEPRQLSVAEIALLTAIPQSPEARRPDRHFAVAQAAKNRVLSALVSRGVIAVRLAEPAMDETPGGRGHPLTRSAPHLSVRLQQVSPAVEVVPTLIDKDLQQQVERIASRGIMDWGEAVNIAILVLRNRDASVAAYLGGVDFSAESRKGFVDLVQAIRSPGSALKPFIYAMAFEKLIVHPDTIITDRPVEIRGYRPENADGRFAGDISVREALIRSRNTTAVMVLEQVGVDAFLARFRSAGRALALPAANRSPGLAVGLGGVGTTLQDLTWFYTAFPNEGVLHALRLKASDPAISLGHFISPAAARATADILADLPSPAGYARLRSADGGRRVALKTGTSYGFRDAWAVGFDQLHTVGVWVGRPDGAAHLGAYGVTAAAPILMHVFDRLPIPAHDVAKGTAELGSLTGFRELPDRLARFNQLDQQEVVRPLEIAFPRNGANIRTDRGVNGAVEFPVIAEGGNPPYRWIFSGAVQPPSIVPTNHWSVTGSGQFEIAVIDAAGSVAKSSFWLE
jgi:penicillin-binding protein 1C